MASIRVSPARREPFIRSCREFRRETRIGVRAPLLHLRTSRMLTNNPVKDSIIAMSNHVLMSGRRVPCRSAVTWASFHLREVTACRFVRNCYFSTPARCAWTRLAWMSPEEACLVAGPRPACTNTLRWDIFVNACDRRAAISRCLCFTNARALPLCNV